MNYSSNFWITASRFFIVELAFCEHDKNYKVDDFKNSHESLFSWSRVLFYLIIALHKKCLHLSVFSLNAGKWGPE